jgi:hypothetical protein
MPGTRATHSAEVEDQLRGRGFAIIHAYLRGDLEGIAALVGDDDVELLPMLLEILVGAPLRLAPLGKSSAS